MSLDLAAALVVFALVTLFTPGPNNVMLMASGLNFGFARTRGHMLGVALGFAFMVLLVGLGLGAVFETWPALYAVIKYAGAAYLLYLAWRIATAGPVGRGETRGRPLNFLEAVAFQWVNPKAWVMSVGATTAYAAVALFPWNMLFISGVFALLGLVSSAVWIVFGTGLRALLAAPWAVRAFNIVRSLALVGSLYPVLADVVP
jgi:threonine/homoserine/homoserine lactone efflux protein